MKPAGRLSLQCTLACLAVAFASNRSEAQNLLYQVDSVSSATGLTSFAYTVAGVGDVTQDGIPDIAVADLLGGQLAFGYGPVVRIHSGATGAVALTIGSIQYYGALFGAAICGAGDLDGDGYPDVAVGSPLANDNGSDSGAVRFFSGKTGAPLFSIAGDDIGDRLGGALANLGDIDQDGNADFAAGAVHDDSSHGVNCGAVWVISGGSHAASFKGYGDAAYDLLGTAVAGVGDIDGDGSPDAAAGTYRFLDTTHPGYVRIFSPKTGASLLQIVGGAPLDGFGSAVSTAGDLDLDGVPDLVIGAPLSDTVRVHSGKDGHLLATLSGAAGSQFGITVVGGVDLTGDGVPDLVVGAPFENVHAGITEGGTVNVFSGASFAKLYHADGGKAFDHFGSTLAIVGNVDSQGSSDLAAGMRSTNYQQPLPHAEYFRVYRGACGLASKVGVGCPGSLGFVPSLDVAGCFASAGQVSMKIDQCIGNAPVIVLLGVGQANLPLANGCHLYLGQLLPVSLLLSTNNGSIGGASVTLDATLPLLSPQVGGATIRMQAFIQDPGAPGGHSGTGAVEMKFD